MSEIDAISAAAPLDQEQPETGAPPDQPELGSGVSDDNLSEEDDLTTELMRRKKYRLNKLEGDSLEYMRRAHIAYRVIFGLYLNQDPIQSIITKVYSTFPGSSDMREEMEAIAWKRLRNLCASWKMKTIRKLKAHVQSLCEDNDVFSSCTDLKTLHHFLKNTFDLDNWAEILEPWRKSVNVRASEKSVHRWCKSLYVDMGARIKLMIDWESVPARTRPAEYEWDNIAIGVRFETITRTERYRQIRPLKKDIMRISVGTQERPFKRRKREVELVDPENDPNLYVEDD